MTAYETQLAANDGVVAIITILIMVASGVINFLRERTAEAKRKRELEELGGRTEDGRLQSEIDEFINEVTTAARSQPARGREPVVVLTDDDVIQQPPPSRGAKQTGKQPTKRQTKQRPFQESNIGQVAKRHVASQVREHHLQSQVENSHRSSEVDLGAGSAVAGLLAGDAAAAHPIATLLMTPDGARNAILLSEILAPPLTRRKT